MNEVFINGIDICTLCIDFTACMFRLAVACKS